jgi:hypothetical protein
MEISGVITIKVGTRALMEEFQKLITKDNTKKAHDNLLDELKLAIKEASSNSHQWDNKAMDSLVSYLNRFICLF